MSLAWEKQKLRFLANRKSNSFHDGSMQILITGGTGFIGSRLGLRCLADGDEVRILGQENTEAEAENRKEIEEAGGEVVLGSVLDAPLVRDVVEHVDVVFHLAATQHEMDIPDRRFRDVNVRGTETVLQAAAAAGIDRFVYGSTIGVYGRPEGTIDESTGCRPDNIYGETKLEAEKRVLASREALPAVVVRIPEVYGPGDRRLLKLFRAIDRGVFVMIGSGKNLHHPIYIEDLVNGLLAAARVPAAIGELLLFAGKETVTTREMVEAIAGALGKTPPRWSLPLAPFAGLARVLELALRPFGVQPPLHRRRLDFFRKSFRLDATKARETIGFSPRIGFVEGARRTAEWYRQKGYVR